MFQPSTFFLFQGSATIYNNPELEMLAKEIQSLLSEKISLEKELQDSEYQAHFIYSFQFLGSFC